MDGREREVEEVEWLLGRVGVATGFSGTSGMSDPVESAKLDGRLFRVKGVLAAK